MTLSSILKQKIANSNIAKLLLGLMYKSIFTKICDLNFVIKAYNITNSQTNSVRIIFTFLIMMLLTSCSLNNIALKSDYNSNYIEDNEAIIVSKIYSNQELNIKQKESLREDSLSSLVKNAEQNDREITNIEIGGEVIIALNGCRDQNNHYIIGKKINFDAGSLSILPINSYIFALNDDALEANFLQQSKESYQYKALYHLSSIPAGYYQICQVRNYYLDNENKIKQRVYENIAKQQNIDFYIRAGEVIYLGDILLEKSKIKIIYQPKYVQDYIDSFFPELSEKLMARILCSDC